MANYLDYDGLKHYHSLLEPKLSHKALSSADDGIADKASSIPFGTVDSTSTSTAYTAQVDGITELRDGVCLFLHNNKVTSASGFTVDINGLGAKPVYYAYDGSRSTGEFVKDRTLLLMYNSSRVSGGCWDYYAGAIATANTDVIGYDIRLYYHNIKPLYTTYRYLFLLTKGNYVIPVNEISNSTATTKRLTTESFDPFGEVYYYGSTTTKSAGETFGADTLYTQAAYTVCDLRYSFNTGSTLIAGQDIYLVCIAQPDGSVVLHTNPISQSLPTSEDGLIYKKLGKAYDTYRIILTQHKPVYYYKDGGVRAWQGELLQTNNYQFALNRGDFNGEASIVGIKGNSCVWNQLCNVSDFPITKISDNTSGSSTNYIPAGIRFVTGDISSHYIYTRFDYTLNSNHSCSSTSSYFYSYLSDSQAFNSVYLNDKQPGEYTASSIKNYSTNSYTNTYQTVEIGIAAGDYVDITFNSFIAIDLTKLFGAGREITSVSLFEEWLRRNIGFDGIYNYNTGTLISTTITGFRTTGYNLYNDGDVFGLVVGLKYKVDGYYDDIYYDRNRIDIELDEDDCFVAKFKDVCIGGNSTTCVHFADVNKNYEPYKITLYNLNIPQISVPIGNTLTAIFPDGMKRVGDVCDEIKIENGVIKIIKRVGSMDIGSMENVTKLVSNGRDIFHIAFTDAKRPFDMYEIPNMFCSKFVPASRNSTWANGNVVYPDANTTININRLGFVTTANTYANVNAFLDAMDGVMLYYELAEPVEYTYNESLLPFNFTENTSETIEMLSSDLTISPILDIKYAGLQLNVTNTVINQLLIEILDLTQ